MPRINPNELSPLHASASLSARELAGLTMLRARLLASWRRTTSVDPDWSLKNPSSGQSDVTALIVQDLLGGQILGTQITTYDKKHRPLAPQTYFWNELPSGCEVELAQAVGYTTAPPEVHQRAHLLQDSSRRARYHVLAGRLREAGLQRAVAAYAP
jgi:hypothetical protein